MIGILIVLALTVLVYFFIPDDDGERFPHRSFPRGALVMFFLVYLAVAKFADNVSFHYNSVDPKASLYEKYELVPKETIPLTTLKTNDLVQGHIGLFGGYIDEIEYLFYLTPSNTGYSGDVRGKIQMDYCEIIQTDSISPCIVKNNILVTPLQRKHPKLYFIFCSNKAEEIQSEQWSGSFSIKPYKVYIPVGSVITKIQIQ